MTWDDSLRWVLAVDEIQILYDTWSEADQNWTLRTSNPPTLFYKSFHHNFKELSEYVGYDELTEDEIQKFGLTLPMALCRYHEFSWSGESFRGLQEFSAYCENQHLRLPDKVVLKFHSVVLIPYDRKMGMGEGITVHAQNENGFSEVDLLWNAHNIQAPVQNRITEGIGLHRQGWIAGLASYYIGGYYDLGDYLRMHDELKQQPL